MNDCKTYKYKGKCTDFSLERQFCLLTLNLQKVEKEWREEHKLAFSLYVDSLLPLTDLLNLQMTL